MRHRNKKITLGRERKQRVALMRGLAESFFLEGKIITTEAKAKALRGIVEPLITKTKTGTLAGLRAAQAYLYTEKALKRLTKEIAPKYKDRRGGYTRITKISPRRGDAAKMARIELV